MEAASLKEVITKADLKDMATKTDLAEFEKRFVRHMHTAAGIIIIAVGLMIKFL